GAGQDHQGQPGRAGRDDAALGHPAVPVGQVHRLPRPQPAHRRGMVPLRPAQHELPALRQLIHQKHRRHHGPSPRPHNSTPRPTLYHASLTRHAQPALWTQPRGGRRRNPPPYPSASPSPQHPPGLGETPQPTKPPARPAPPRGPLPTPPPPPPPAPPRWNPAVGLTTAAKPPFSTQPPGVLGRSPARVRSRAKPSTRTY